MAGPAASLVVAELKRTLREQDLTYADLAQHLRLSLPTIKRMFSKGDFTLERIERIAELAGSSLADVVERSRDRAMPTRQLTAAQEQEIVSDPRLLLITWLVLNRATLQSIVRHYNLPEREVLRYFIRLDRLKVIELQPGNRARLLVSRHFSWRLGGPVQRYVHEKLLKEFLDSNFAGADEEFYFHGYLLSEPSLAALKRVLRQAERECAEIVENERAPHEQRIGAAFVIALRRWGFSGFRQFER